MSALSTVRLGDVCQIIAGQHIEASLYNNEPQGSPYLTGPADFGDRIPIVSKWTKHPKVFAADTDVLLTVKGAGVGKTNYGCIAAIGRQLMALRPDGKHLNQAFLFQFLRHQAERIGSLAQGATVPGIGKEDVSGLRIPLPPIADQRRIADVLDRAEALRAKRRATLSELQTLGQTTFFDLFGDPSSNPHHWPLNPVSIYVAEFQGGKSMEAENGETATKNRVLKVSAVSEMKYRSDESKPVPDTYAPPSEHFVRVGDLLISRANTTELVGAVAYVETTPPNMLLPDKIWRFVWRETSQVEPLFVWALFQTATLRREIAKRATGTSGSMKNISQEKLLGIPTILPPPSLQREFARRISAIEKLKGTHRQSLAELDSLFSSLQHRAFRGEL